MKFLVGENLSRRLVTAFTAAGHDAIHVADLGLESAPDRTILESAADQSRILVSADTDFGTLLAETGASTPSMILIRRISNRRSEALAALSWPTSTTSPMPSNKAP